MYITGEEPFAFAGIHDRWHGPDGILRSCSILTTAATPAIAPLHHRMACWSARTAGRPG
ncbi:MAG: SOS response-associated peptidase family protein [Frankiaceae bacterium]